MVKKSANWHKMTSFGSLFRLILVRQSQCGLFLTFVWVGSFCTSIWVNSLLCFWKKKSGLWKIDTYLEKKAKKAIFSEKVNETVQKNSEKITIFSVVFYIVGHENTYNHLSFYIQVKIFRNEKNQKKQKGSKM